MCDYSLEAYRSTPARTGETYETHRFASGTVGFVAKGDRETAVCMSCDTRVTLENIPQPLQASLSISPRENVVFTRLEEGPHHDGVRFSNGAQVTLQRLGSGVSGTVTDALEHEPKIKAPMATLFVPLRARETENVN